jgi:hypothetical protein
VRVDERGELRVLGEEVALHVVATGVGLSSPNLLRRGVSASGKPAASNPQIPKAEGDEPVRAYIAAHAGMQALAGRAARRADRAHGPDVHKAAKWNHPFYGHAGEGWFLAFRPARASAASVGEGSAVEREGLGLGERRIGRLWVYEWPDEPHELVTLMRVRARITDPAPEAVIPAGTYTVRGKAWSGTGPITDVHVSLTGEGDWYPAKVEHQKGPHQWQDWSFEWDAGIGRTTLRARATDAAGNVQPDLPPWNRLGYGNNAVEVIYVDVR